jgi:adenylosuccinate synthase
MKKNIFIVIGLGFGDEGKGLSTDFLCLQNPNSLVIRFNGGQQAGHTVWTSKHGKHVFSNFGAGSLRNAPTYWSRFCTFAPASFCKEWEALQGLNPSAKIFIDKLCPVSTHYDQLYNRVLEEKRGKTRHGSCGLGFGATIERHHHSPVKLFAQDLLFPEIVSQKLKTIRSYYEQKFLENNLEHFAILPHNHEDERFLSFVAIIHLLEKQNTLEFVSENTLLQRAEFENLIFEGAQGVLLDMDFGFFPNVTRSNTTSQNALTLLRNNQIKSKEISIWYVSRTYLTRHGAGFLPNEEIDLNLIHTEQETNQYNDFQGVFRKAPLHLPLMDFALTCDANFSEGIEKNLILTCADQLPNQELPIFMDKLSTITLRQLKKDLQHRFENVFVSQNHCAEFL